MASVKLKMLKKHITIHDIGKNVLAKYYVYDIM